MIAGRVEGIFVTSGPSAPPRDVDEAEAIAGLGLAGDRYAERTGTWYKPEKTGQHLTLIEAETLEEIGLISARESRRNIVTRGLRVADLLGRRFRIGDAVCIGVRDCPPCTHLEGLTVAGVKDALEGRGGLRADVVESGRIAVGDSIESLQAFEPAVVDSAG